ncbi:MAG: hypothetical protein U5J82_05330 [Desulfobacterales bacterium]|nr:hypothetical protein [Desulfobacterales bacterium]
MKARLWMVVMVGVAVLVGAGPVHGQDMRARETEARQTREALMQQATAEQRAAEAEAAAARARIADDRAALDKAIATLGAKNARLETAVGELTGAVQSMEEEEAALSAQLAETDSVIRELVGLIRVAAKDTTALWRENLQSALDRPDLAFLQAIAEQARFPEWRTSAGWWPPRGLHPALGQVGLGRGTTATRSGRATARRYPDPWLLHRRLPPGKTKSSPRPTPRSRREARRPLPASRPPRIRRQIARYMAGEGEAVYVDISRGAAAPPATHQLASLSQAALARPDRLADFWSSWP